MVGLNAPIFPFVWVGVMGVWLFLLSLSDGSGVIVCRSVCGTPFMRCFILSLYLQAVVREKFHAVRVCSVHEAAEEMEQMGHAFFAFRNTAGPARYSSPRHPTNSDYPSRPPLL